MTSTLDRFRRPGEAPASVSRAPQDAPLLAVGPVEDEESGFYEWTENRHYEALRVRNRPVRHLHIVPNAPIWHSAPYRHFLYIVQDGSHSTFLVVVYSFMVVKIKGRNLQTLASSILVEHCHAIRAFNPAKDEMPADPKAPFIESIEVVIEKGMGDVLQKEAGSRNGGQ